MTLYVGDANSTFVKFNHRIEKRKSFELWSQINYVTLFYVI